MNFNFQETKMKKLFLTLFSAIMILAPVSAVEWGGLIDNTSQFIYMNNDNSADSNPLSLSQSDAAYLWLSAPLTSDGNVYIKTEGMYKLTSYKGYISHLADLDLLKCAGTIPMGKATLDFSAGRFQISDISGAVFSQNCDGAYVNYAAPKFGVSAYAGYTGLLNSNIVYMLDKNGAKHIPANKVYALSNPYIPVSASVSFPYLFLNQSLTLQGNGFFDLSENKYNRIYGEMMLSGAVAPTVFYNFISDFGSDFETSLMNYTKLNFSIFAGRSLISTGVEYASGNNGVFSAFRGFSTHTAYSCGNGDIETSGVILATVGANLPIGRNMLIASNIKGVFACPEKELTPAGLQADLSYLYNIFSDLQLTALVSDFISFNNNYADKLSVTLKIALSF